MPRGMRNKNKTHCLRGHEFTKENTYIQKASGGRTCRRCLYDRNAVWEKNNPEKAKAIRKSAARLEVSRLNHRKHALRVCGWTEEKYDAALKIQNGKCAICGDCSSTLHADHEHVVPPNPRKLLCRNCNTALGLFKENPTALRAAAAYVEEHKVAEKH
jgi:hypothetical protein